MSTELEWKMYDPETPMDGVFWIVFVRHGFDGDIDDDGKSVGMHVGGSRILQLSDVDSNMRDGELHLDVTPINDGSLFQFGDGDYIEQYAQFVMPEMPPVIKGGT